MTVQQQAAASQNSATRVDPDDPLAPPPIPTNTLPDNGDGQGVVVPLSAQRDGLSLDIPLWKNPAEFPDETDTVFFYIDNRLADFALFDGPITDDPVKVTFKSSALQQHGEKEINYIVQLAFGNRTPSEPTTVFVDTIDPNLNNKPSTIRLPADLPGNTITPEYLRDHNNGITLTIPDPHDRRRGDIWKFFWGESAAPTLEDNVPDVGPITVFVPASTIMALGEGDRIITYQLMDRAGNETQTSLPTTVNVQLNDPPSGLLPPVVVGTRPISKEMARQGVLVQVLAFVDFQPNDELSCTWQGVEIGSYRFSGTPTFPLEFTAEYGAVSGPGNEYDAQVTYVLRRGTQDFAPPAPTVVAVNLTEPGEDNPGPGPVDPTLELPLVKGPSNLDNVLVPEDRGEPATATFTIYSGFSGGERIELYYGPLPGELADTYDVQGDEPDDFVVTMEIPWALIDQYGNGDIPCYYRVHNAVNYKDSTEQLVIVRIFELEGLEDPSFEKLHANGNIQCDQEPWKGVPVRIHDPASLQANDEVTVHAIRYTFNPVVPVAGSEIAMGPYTVGDNDVRDGFTRVLDLPYFALYTETRGRGYVGVRWSIYRPSTDDRGSSGERRVQWDVRSAAPSGTCVPGATRSIRKR